MRRLNLESSKNIDICSLILSFIGISLWFFTLSGPLLFKIDINSQFGLINVLPPVFPLSLFILTICILLSCFRKKELYFLLNLIVLSSAIWGTASFVEHYPRFWDSYYAGYTTDYIMKNGWSTFPLAEDFKLDDFYLQYPGFFILFSIFVKISNIELLRLLKYYPVIASPLIFFSVYVLFIKILNKSIASKMAILTFLLLNSSIGVNIHFCPQSYGLYLYSIIILILVDLSREKIMLMLLMLFVLIFTHPLTYFFILLLIIIIYIIYSINFKSLTDPLANINRNRFIVFLIMIFMSWHIFVATVFFGRNIRNLLEIIVNAIYWEARVVSILERRSLFLPSLINQIFFISTFAIVGLYFLYQYINKKPISFFNLAWLLTPIIFMFSAIITKGIWVERVDLFGYFPISLLMGFLINNIKSKKRFKYLFIIIIIIFLFKALATDYFGENMYLYSEGDMSAYRFSANFSEGSIFAHQKGSEFIHFFNINLLAEEIPLEFKLLDLDKIPYDIILISDRSILYFMIHRGNSYDEIYHHLINLQNNTDINHIYCNSKIKIYIKNSVK
jgi:hypothetical protein